MTATFWSIHEATKMEDIYEKGNTYICKSIEKEKSQKSGVRGGRRHKKIQCSWGREKQNTTESYEKLLSIKWQVEHGLEGMEECEELETK